MFYFTFCRLKILKVGNQFQKENRLIFPLLRSYFLIKLSQCGDNLFDKILSHAITASAGNLMAMRAKRYLLTDYVKQWDRLHHGENISPFLRMSVKK